MQIHFVVITFVELEYKKYNPANQINHAGNALLTDSHGIHNSQVICDVISGAWGKKF